MKTKKKVSIREIEEKALRGENVNKYFSKGEMKPGTKNLFEIQRVNVDFTKKQLKELDRISKELNISRQAVIKSFLSMAIADYRTGESAPKASGD